MLIVEKVFVFCCGIANKETFKCNLGRLRACISSKIMLDARLWYDVLVSTAELYSPAKDVCTYIDT